MKTKIFTLFFVFVASVGTILASDTQVDGIWYKFDTRKKTAEVTFKETDAHAYSDRYSGSIVIPNSVVYNGAKYSVIGIGEYAFYGCTGLISIEIPNSVTSIKENAFYGCAGLTSVTIGNSVASIGKKAFYNCRVLSSIDIPNSVSSIGISAFEGCTSLISMTMGQGVISIGENAFYSCSSLISADIPDNATDIGNCAFYNCSSLTSVTIGNSVTSIGSQAFSGCGNMTSLSLGNNLKSIGSNAFRDCRKLQSVTLPDSVTSIGKSAFYNCSSIKSITIPVNVTEYGYYVVAGCTSLTSITWNVRKLSNNSSGGHFFYMEYGYNISKQIVSFTFGEEVEKIPSNICEEMTQLTSITIPDKVTFIVDAAFRNCSNLTSITIPASVNMLGRNLFEGCSKLEHITMLPDTPPYIFNNIVDTLVPIYVPCGTLEAYQATDWSDYNIQYQPYPFELNVTSAEYQKGSVISETGNACEISSLSAIPNEGYYFVQWSDGNTDNPRNIILTKDTTIAAIFGPFTITFVDDNDTILASQEYEYGATIIPPTDPIKTNDAQYTYTFAGWSPQFVAVTSDATYKATYTAHKKTEAIDTVFDNSAKPVKYIENNNIYILMPNGNKYSIIGEQVK